MLSAVSWTRCPARKKLPACRVEEPWRYPIPWTPSVRASSVLHACPRWDGINVAEAVTEQSGLPALIENDACGAISESCTGVAVTPSIR